MGKKLGRIISCGWEKINLPRIFYPRHTVLLIIEIFTFLPCNLLTMAPIFSIIGRTLQNFIDIVRCKPNFD